MKVPPEQQGQLQGMLYSVTTLGSVLALGGYLWLFEATTRTHVSRRNEKDRIIAEREKREGSEKDGITAEREKREGRVRERGVKTRRRGWKSATE